MIKEKRVFSLNDIERAESNLSILALLSKNYWARALRSESVGDYEVELFKDCYSDLTREEIKELVKNDINIALILNKPECIGEIERKDCLFSFGGWDNSKPYGLVSKALVKAGINFQFGEESEYINSCLTLKRDIICLRRNGLGRTICKL